MGLTQVSTDGVKNDAITKVKIPANQIEASELADNAVDTNAIANNAVTAGKLASGVQTTINNNADNRVITGSGTANTLEGEADLTFDGNDLTINKTSGDSDVIIKTTTSGNPVLKLNASGAGGHDISHDRSSNSLIFNRTGSAERMRIDSSGRVLIGTTTEGGDAADDLTIANTGHAGITIRSGTSNVGSLYFSDGTSGDDEFRGAVQYNHTSNFLRFFSDASERMRIDSSGNVGIGTSSPSNLLTLEHSANASNGLVVKNTNNSQGSADALISIRGGDNAQSVLELECNGQNHQFVESGTGDLKIFDNATERMRIDSSGNVGINVSSPAAKLHIGDNASGTTDMLILHANADGAGENNGIASIKLMGDSEHAAFIKGGHTNNGHTILTFHTDPHNSGKNPQQRMIIDHNGAIGAPSGTNIFNPSDSRVKKNVVDLDKGLSTIKSLRPVSFNWIDGFCDEEKDTLYGFIAQEVQTVDNNLTQDFAQGIMVNDTKIDNVLRVNEKFIIPMLVKAVQELTAKVEALEAK